MGLSYMISLFALIKTYAVGTQKNCKIKILVTDAMFW